MSTDLVSPSAGSALSTILADPSRLHDIPVETVERLFELDRRMRSDAARDAFYAAFSAAQRELEPVRKLGKNTHTASMYARAEDVCRMLDPVITRHGFSRSISTEDSPLAEHMRFVLTIRHESGHAERHTFDAPVDDRGIKGQATKTRLHGMASSYTYVERHLLMKVWGVQTVADDDGNRGAGIGPSAETITDNQVADLRALIEEAGANDEAFRKVCKVDKWEELPASMYKAAVRRLDMKRRA